MDIFVTVCITLGMVAVISVAVYLILTLTQLRRTSRSLEVLLDNVNKEVVCFDKWRESAAGLASSFGGAAGKSVSGLVCLLKALVRVVGKSGKKNKEESTETAGSQ